MNSFVKNVIKAHNEAKTYNEWEESQYNLSHLNHEEDFEAMAAMTAMTPWEEELACNDLLAVDRADLTLFYDLLKNNPNFLPKCRNIAIQRLFDFWAGSEKQMKALVAKNKTEGTLGFESRAISTVDGKVFFSGDLPANEILLTFDDGPHPVNTPVLLDLLNDYGVKVNFFTVGRNAKASPELVKRATEEGHIVGNHTWSHQNLKQLSAEAGELEISKGFNAIKDALSFYAPFFRFPYGNSTKHLTTELKASHNAIFYWNMDTLDWKIKDPTQLLEYSLAQVAANKGGIILFHDIQFQTIKMMPYFLESLKSQNFKVVQFTPELYKTE